MGLHLLSLYHKLPRMPFCTLKARRFGIAFLEGKEEVMIAKNVNFSEILKNCIVTFVRSLTR